MLGMAPMGLPVIENVEASLGIIRPVREHIVKAGAQFAQCEERRARVCGIC